MSPVRRQDPSRPPRHKDMSGSFDSVCKSTSARYVAPGELVGGQVRAKKRLLVGRFVRQCGKLVGVGAFLVYEVFGQTGLFFHHLIA